MDFANARDNVRLIAAGVNGKLVCAAFYKACSGAVRLHRHVGGRSEVVSKEAEAPGPGVTDGPSACVAMK